MSPLAWVKIIILVLQLIAEGMNKASAAEYVSNSLGIDIDEILKKMG
ncbi:MAG: hypothetical protein E6X72_06090 [Clostridioides difficile]|nr:hypothetical protein [Clostridioides difficile]